jgi:hypothetical protein
MLPDGGQEQNTSPLTAVEAPPEVPPPPPDPREPALNACMDAILWCASLVTAESRPDEVKSYGAAAEGFARAMSLINPPMKPIDPNLHADHRGVDPQAVFDTAAAADKQAADQQHELEKQAADQAHQAGLKAMDAATQQPEKPKPQT